MTSMTVLPYQTEWTVDDLDALPDDGLQHELIDGLHIVSPAPIPHHQFVVARLAFALHRATPDDLHVLFAPLDWRPSRTVNLQPDVLVVPTGDLTDRDAKNLTRPLLLAVEVLSPSTRRKTAFSSSAPPEARCRVVLDRRPGRTLDHLLGPARRRLRRGRARLGRPAGQPDSAVPGNHRSR